MDKFFEGNFNETWNTTLNQFDALVGNISLYISCFEFNKFMAMPNEYEMEKLGIQLVDRKQLWAGIVFTNIERTQKTDDLPRFIQYKLRMDADTVDSTYHVEDRIPRPYPRRRPQIDLKYLYFGFSFLQVKYNKIAICNNSNLGLQHHPLQMLHSALPAKHIECSEISKKCINLGKSY